MAVVVTTYNRPDALSWVLAALHNQTLAPHLIVVADDGSGVETSVMVESLIKAQQSPRPIFRHVWQPDNGFRAGQIRNKGVAECLKDSKFSRGQVIFLDGDCVPLPNFIERHVQLLTTAGQGWCVAGGRSLLDKGLTSTLEASPPGPLKNIYLERITLRVILKWRLHGHINRVLPLLPVPGMQWRCAQPHRWEKFRTCNASLWSDDFLKINGFDENYVGWGFEDSDLAIRLFRSGIKIMNGRYATNVLHLWHPEFSREAIDKNKELLSQAWSRPLRAEAGVQQHLGIT